MGPNDLPGLTARHVLIDMDFTITWPTAPPDAEWLQGIAGDNYYLALLRDVVARKRGIDRQTARAVIESVVDPYRQCLFTILGEIDVDPADYWREIAAYHAGHLAAYPDAVEMIKVLHAHGYAFYTATTNSRMAALSKLAYAGLADMNGSPYFEGFFGGDICEGGKGTPVFFETLLQLGGFAPGDCLMIGDDPEQDCAAAKAAGIEQVVLPRRDQAEDIIVEADGGIYVKSLMVVPQLLGI